ncbi:MAG: hypothetical protein KKE40_05925, partial [Planctomycetes bacterium]|nr:hypothetical protein [Planctomycetota bacterium]
MPEQVKAPVIPKISEQMTLEKRDNVTAAIKTAMEQAKNPNRAMEGTESWDAGKKGWEEHVGSLAPLATSMLESQLTDRRPSIWQIACLFNQADPDRILWQVGKDDRQLVLDLLGETADEVWGEESADKIETGIYDGSDLFDPGRLPIDFFGIAAEAIEALRKEKLLPLPLGKQLWYAEQTKHQLFETNAEQARKIEALNVEAKTNGQWVQVIKAAETISEWPDNLRSEKVEELLKDLPEAARTIFRKAVKIREAKFVAEDIPEIIKDLPLLERMAVMLKSEGRFAVEVSGKDIQPLMECVLPDVSLLKALPGTELSITTRKGERGMGVAVRLGQMAQKKEGEEEFEGIMVDFVLGNGQTGLARSGEVDLETNLPGKTKTLLAVLGKMDQHYSLNYIKDEITSRTSFIQTTLNEWLII